MSASMTADSAGDANRPFRPSRVLWRRGPALVSFVATVAISVAHVALRTRWWRYEWFWAWYQFHFVTILLGPFLAGVSCWWGTRWAGSQRLVATSARAPGAVTSLVGAVLGPCVLAYVGGLVAISAITASNTRSVPPVSVVASAAPALMLLTALAAGSFALGIRSAHGALAPLVAVATFVVLLVGYMVGLTEFVKVGGATASLLGLGPRAVVEVGQVLFYAGLAGLAIAGAAWKGPGRSRALTTLVVAALLVTLAGWAVLERQHGREFENVATDLVCRGERPTICVGPGYARLIGRLHGVLEPHYRALAAADLPAPEAMVQIPTSRYPGAAPMDPASTLRSPRFSDGYVLSGFIPDGCDPYVHDRAGKGFATLSTFLQEAYPVAGRIEVDAVRRGELQRAFDDLTTCRP